MIICKNCGGEFDHKAPKCPYCGYENAAVAQDIYHKMVDEIVSEREEINKLPKIVTNKAAVIFAICVMLLVAVVITVPVIRVKQQEAVMQNKTSILDEYLENGQYQEFYDFYKEVREPLDLFGYWEVYTAFEEYIQIKKEVEDVFSWTDDSSDDYKINDVSDILYETRRLNDYVTKHMSDRTLYGNEEYLEEIFLMAKEYVLKVSPVDLESLEAVLAYSDEEDLNKICDEYGKTIVDGMK